MNRAWTFPAAIGACLLAACGGGGGGGPTGPSPTIVAAAFVGATSTPAAGDNLLLFLSVDAILVAGALLTDADFDLTGGASLGDVTVAPSLINSRTVQLTLGAGVTFAPGTTTIAFGAGNDAVTGTGGVPGSAGTPTVIATSDGALPTVTAFTLSGVDAVLNGTGAAGGTLQVPQHSFTIDAAWTDNSQVDPARAQITANVTVATASGNQPAGTNLVPFLTAGTVNTAGGSWTVPSSTTFPQGAVTLTVFAVDITGLASAGTTFSFLVKNYTDALRPFETNVNSSQVWYLDLSRDIESFSVNLAATPPVAVASGANGRADLQDILLTIGLLSTTPIANVSGGLDSNDVVMERFRTALAADLASLYSGCNITFTFTQPGGSFGSQTSVAYNSLGFSRISIAGAATASGTSGILGVAIFDPSNTTQNDDTVTDFQGQRLGIFLHTVINDGFTQGSTTPFRQTFDPFTPARGGTPIGNNASDGQRLLGTLSDSRRTQIDAAIAGIARFTAVVTAHECGHSMGLVKGTASDPRPMPSGLYGGDSANFPGSADGHIRNTSLFPAGATNVMSPTLNYSLSLHTSTAFNSLNLAYLRERVLHDDN